MLNIHTFEMKKSIDAHDEMMWIGEKLKGIQFEPIQRDTYTRIRYYGLAGNGVIIIVFWYRYMGRGEICLQITPCKVLGIQDGVTLFNANEEVFQQCLRRVDQVLNKYHLSLCDYRMSRVDFTQDVRFERSETIETVIRLLKKTGSPQRYHDKYYGDRVYKDSYNIADQEGSEVVVYNKEKQSAGRDEKQSARMKGVMRVEVRIQVSHQQRQIFIGNMLDFQQLLEEREYAEVKIKNVFYEGFYLKVKKIREILEKEYGRSRGLKRQQNKLQKMIELVNGVAVHQSLNKCIRGKDALFCYDTIKDIITQFAERRINLVAISAKEPFIVLPDMLYLLGMKSESEIRRDHDFLMEHKLLDKVPKFELL